MRLYLPKVPLIKGQHPKGWWIAPGLILGAVAWFFIIRAIYRATTGGAD
ncbi:MAG: hypothetical protein ACX93U_24835 [Salipiger thiooxidans]|nr:hypothetical protein [Salipiger thiooxidans]